MSVYMFVDPRTYPPKHPVLVSPQTPSVPVAALVAPRAWLLGHRLVSSNFKSIWGACQYKDAVLPVGIPIIKIRRSWSHPIFIMEIPYMKRPSLYWDRALDISGTFWLNAKLQNIGMKPWWHVSYAMFNIIGDIDCSLKMQCYEETVSVHNVSPHNITN